VTPSETLIAARKLIERPERLAVGAVARDGRKESVGIFSEATSFSITGALMHGGGMLEPEWPVPPHVYAAMNALIRAEGVHKWSAITDKCDLASHSQVLRMIDNTITRVKSSYTAKKMKKAA
jgi:hypothetical protein